MPDLNKKTKQCPYCGEDILDVAIKCKHCGEFLNEEPPAREPKGSKASEWTRSLSTKEIVFFLAMPIVALGLFMWVEGSGKLEKFWAHLIFPFDSKPTVTVSEIIQDPDQVTKKKKELCAWAKREELRNPSIWTKARRGSACKDIK